MILKVNIHDPMKPRWLKSNPTVCDFPLIQHWVTLKLMDKFSVAMSTDTTWKQWSLLSWSLPIPLTYLLLHIQHGTYVVTKPAEAIVIFPCKQAWIFLTGSRGNALRNTWRWKWAHGSGMEDVWRFSLIVTSFPFLLHLLSQSWGLAVSDFAVKP